MKGLFIMSEIEKYKALSTARFRAIEPIIKNLLGATALINIEDEQSEALTLLDYKAGIDAIAIINNSAFGIASRMSTGEYKAFTIREHRQTTNIITEFEKRKKEMTDASLKPAFTVQAYFSPGKVEIALCKTAELIDYVASNRNKYQVRTSSDGRNVVDFLVINWSDYKATGKFFKRTTAMLYNENASVLRAV